MVCGCLPFDDDPLNPDGSNIGRLYWHIVSSPLKLPNFLSVELKDLLSKMLQIYPAHRISISSIKMHAWLQKNLNSYENEFPVQLLSRGRSESQDSLDSLLSIEYRLKQSPAEIGKKSLSQYLPENILRHFRRKQIKLPSPSERLSLTIRVTADSILILVELIQIFLIEAEIPFKQDELTFFCKRRSSWAFSIEICVLGVDGQFELVWSSIDGDENDMSCLAELFCRNSCFVAENKS